MSAPPTPRGQPQDGRGDPPLPTETIAGVQADIDTVRQGVSR